MTEAEYSLHTRPACPACGNSASETLCRVPYASEILVRYLSDYYSRPVSLPGNYQADRCLNCDTLFQREMGNAALLNAIYDEWIAPSDPMQDPAYRFDVEHPRQSRDGHEIIVAAAWLGIPLNEFETLDYGMGWASWARISARLGCRSHGDDLAESRRDYAATFGILPDNSTYHFINTEQVMEHVENLIELVGMLSAKLKPGGILKISVPGRMNVEAELARLAAGGRNATPAALMPLHPLEHVNCFSRKGLDLLGERYGLRAIVPDLLARYAFLAESGAMAWTDPRRTAKELIRPIVQWQSTRNTYVWLHKAPQA